MKLHVITLCYNEAVMVPFFIRHYAPWVDAMTFFDGGSSDDTRRIIRQLYPQAVIVDHDTGGEVDDGDNVRIKNTYYKTLKADWFIVVDCDELVYHPAPRDYLTELDRRNVNVAVCQGWDMIGDAIPADGLLTDQICYGVPSALYDKAAVFKRDVDIRFDPGCHSCAPRGARPDDWKTLKLLHYKWLSPDYVQAKADGLRLSAANIANRWGHTPDGQPNNTVWVGYYHESRKRRVKVL